MMDSCHNPVSDYEGVSDREKMEAKLEAAVEDAKRRCRAIEERLEKNFSDLLNSSCKQTLLRLVHSELSFLSRLSSHSNSIPTLPLSVNIGHLEAVVHILQQPFITGVTCVCKTIPLSPSDHNGPKDTTNPKGVHVDIVCTLEGAPVWFMVSDRNPKYICWAEKKSCGNKGLKVRIEQVLDAARSSVALKPSSIILFFSHGLDPSVIEDLYDEFGANHFKLEFTCFECGFSEDLDGEWTSIIARSFQKASVLEIKLDCPEEGVSSPNIKCGVKDCLLGAAASDTERNLGASFCSLISKIKSLSLDANDPVFSISEDLSRKSNLVNFDTTTLIAITSGISNGISKKLLAKPENELRNLFKSNFEFVIAQVMSEVDNPIHMELSEVLSGKGGIVCESVCSEFKELVSMCGGLTEKLRAKHLLEHIMVVPDSPSARMMSLPTTRKLAAKNKSVFGTGDYWHAPTLTANMGFVRAVSQTGMSLFTIQHRSRSLIGD